MATAASTLIARTRRYLRDYPELDTLSGSISSSVTTITTSTSLSNTAYQANWIIQVDQEAILVKTTSSVSGSLTVTRGAWGTTAASHAASANVMIRPAFLDVEILDALNGALDATFPYLYRPVAEEYTGVEADEYEYDVPDMTGFSVPIPHVWQLEYQETTDQPFYPLKGWRVIRRATPIIKLKHLLPGGGVLRVHGFGPFPHLTTTADTLADLFPQNAEDLLPVYAAGWLLGSGEAGRVRVDTGVTDNREQANRVGSSMAAGDRLMNRFFRRLSDCAMPPLPKNLTWNS